MIGAFEPATPALVVLDMIGTTIRADDAVPRAYTAAAAAEGRHLSAADVHGVRGGTKRLALERLFAGEHDGPARAARAYQRFREELRAAYTPATVAPIAGAEDTVRRLRAAGMRVALNTGFDRDLAMHLLDVLGWGAIADLVVCGDDVAAGRPAPDMIRRAMMLAGVTDAGVVANVGDTALDLGAGASAGVRWNIGVWSGAHDRATLEGAPHTHLRASVANVPNVFGLA